MRAFLARYLLASPVMLAMLGMLVVHQGASAQSTPASLPTPPLDWRSKCNLAEVTKNIEYPAKAFAAGVTSGQVRIHASIRADGSIAVVYLDATNPLFDEPALHAASALKCDLSAGVAFTWPMQFELVDDDQPNSKPAPLVFLPRAHSGDSMDQNRVLILVPQGIDAAYDATGLNGLVRVISEPFASRLTEALRARGLQVVNVLDQTSKPFEDKFTTYDIQNLAGRAVILALQPVTVEDDEQIQLKVQYSEPRLISENGRPLSVVPDAIVSRSYFLKGSKSGATTQKVDAMADDFLSVLVEQKRVAPAAAAGAH